MGEDGRESECGEQSIMMVLDTVVNGLLFRVFVGTPIALTKSGSEIS